VIPVTLVWVPSFKVQVARDLDELILKTNFPIPPSIGQRFLVPCVSLKTLEPDGWKFNFTFERPEYRWNRHDHVPELYWFLHLDPETKLEATPEEHETEVCDVLLKAYGWTGIKLI
jgi:hypothetical protein